MKKIVLACFWINETNGGDKLYVATSLKMLKKYAPNVKVEICDFYGRTPVKMIYKSFQKEKLNIQIYRRVRRALGTIYRKVRGMFIKVPKGEDKYERIYKYYQKRLEDADALIVPGGGLVEYSSWRDYYILMEMLEKICNENSISMYVNSVGYVENEAPAEWFTRWSNIINSPCIKRFSCRDNIEFFKTLSSNVFHVPCSACLSADILGYKKISKSNTVGIGMMRPTAYKDYGNNITTKYLLKYYKRLIETLISYGYKVELFSVGVDADHNFGEMLLEYMNRNDVVLLERPETPEKLLEEIARFKGILTVRTHSAYAAFSLDVPAVMVYFGNRGWSGKSTEFMKMVGCPQNAVCCDELTPQQLADIFVDAMNRGWDDKRRAEVKQESLKNFKEVLGDIGVLEDGLEL